MVSGCAMRMSRILPSAAPDFNRQRTARSRRREEADADDARTLRLVTSAATEQERRWRSQRDDQRHSSTRKARSNPRLFVTAGINAKRTEEGPVPAKWPCKLVVVVSPIHVVENHQGQQCGSRRKCGNIDTTCYPCKYRFRNTPLCGPSHGRRWWQHPE
jgi:hypothetical protein